MSELWMNYVDPRSPTAGFGDEASLTHDRERISVSTGSSKHCPSMREEQCEAAQLATAERQHGFVRNPTDLRQKGPVKASGCNESSPNINLAVSILQNQITDCMFFLPVQAAYSILKQLAGGLLNVSSSS